MNARTIALTTVALALSACAAQQGQRQIYTPTPSGVETVPYSTGNGQNLNATPAPPASTAAPATPSYPQNLAQSDPGAAVMSLYEQASQAAQSQNYVQAGALLERALRIAPRNGYIWQALANLHLRMKDYDQALGDAQRANSLAYGNPYLEAGNWRTIAGILQAKGDSAGALQAQSKAAQITQTISQSSSPP